MTVEATEMVERLEDTTKAGIRKVREETELLEFALSEATSEWFYDLELNGAEIEGVGIQGAMEFASFRAQQGHPIRLLNGIELLEVSRNATLGVQATVVAREARTSREGVGVAFFPYFTDVAVDGVTKRVEETRADRKALSIAKRNAILDLIPDEVIRILLAERERIVPLNEARKNAEVIAARHREAAPVRRVTEEQLREENADPYLSPSPLGSGSTMRAKLRESAPVAQISIAQIIRLAQIIGNPSVSPGVCKMVKAQLEKGMSEALAAEWIQILEAETPA